MPVLTVGDQTVEVRQAAPEELHDLRWKILRAGLPRSEAIFPGDELASSLHYIAAAPTGAVCCATFHLNEWQGEPAYQLRGMATDDAFRGMGLGASLLQLAEQDVRTRTDIRRLWCNARTPALNFYRKQGWEVMSEVFHIPTAGPHVKMTKSLSVLA